MNVAVVFPAPTTTEDGTVSAPALLARLTVAPPVFDTVSVQVELAPDPTLAGEHVNPLTTTGANSEIVALCVPPFSVAVIVAVWSLAIVPAVAVNVAVAFPAPTTTEDGTVSAPALLARLTVAPPVFDTVRVQVELAPGPKLAGAHVNPLTATGATRRIVALCVPPFSVAVIVAVWSLPMVPATAVKVAVVLPTPTATDAGTVNVPTLLDSATTAPPVFETATVHVELPPEPRLAGAQVKLLRVTGVASAIVAVCALPLSVAVMVAV
jgi:hypothetical protein